MAGHVDGRRLGITVALLLVAALVWAGQGTSAQQQYVPEPMAGRMQAEPVAAAEVVPGGPGFYSISATTVAGGIICRQEG